MSRTEQAKVDASLTESPFSPKGTPTYDFLSRQIGETKGERKDFIEFKLTSSSLYITRRQLSFLNDRDELKETFEKLAYTLNIHFFILNLLSKGIPLRELFVLSFS